MMLILKTCSEIGRYIRTHESGENKKHLQILIGVNCKIWQGKISEITIK